MSSKSRPPAPPATHPTPAPAGGNDLLDLDQAIARLATTRPTFYRWLRSGRLKGLKVGRQWRFRVADIEAFLHGAAPAETLTADIRPLQTVLAGHLKQAGIAAQADPAHDPVVATISMMIRLGAELRASNLHLEAEHDERAPQLRLRYRIDGHLHEYARADQRLLGPLIQHWKRMACCDLNERRLPQDGRILVDVAGTSYDLRACFLPGTWGESVNLRFLCREAVALSLQGIPFTPGNQARLDAALARPFGLIVCSGPSGSGKTTTVYACLSRLARPEAKVLSIEDPVEFRLPGVTQLGLHAGFGFPAALRAALRSDPDVIHVSQIRDRDTLQGCIQAALDGQVVLTQLHCPDAVSALLRMQELGSDPWELGEAVGLVIAQRLVRRLCPHCSTSIRLEAGQEEQARQIAIQGGLAFADLPREYRRPVGCGKCGQTGYRGRTVINETLAMRPGIAAALRQGVAAAELRRLAIAQGMTTLAADGLWRAARGETSLDEVLRHAPSET